jgi:Cu+-exporting ATPase
VETVNWKVGGMSCANCALTISNYLKKEGLQHVKVNFFGGDVSFEMNGELSEPKIVKGIESLGYEVLDDGGKLTHQRRRFLQTAAQSFIFCLLFTLPLVLHMLDKWVRIPLLMDPWIQLALCIPVYVAGMNFFGPSAYKSVRNGLPNMNVLIVMGATAAFAYSLIGTLFHLGKDYLYYDTAALIITFIFFGNYIEEIAIGSTQRALNALKRSQKVMANMIAFDDQHQEQIFPIENSQLQSGDLILIRSGEQIPADCKILWGDASVNESIITGESMPVDRHAKDKLIGGSMVVDGTIKAQVTAALKDSVLSGIINLVKTAQGEKPPVQQLADRISSVFVPAVLGIAGITLVGNYFYLHQLTPSIMRAIAVLVIACPCAMGLATPAAIAVGLGRAAKNGILFRNAKTLELFKNIGQVVFDKTGTLTTGQFEVQSFFVQSGNLGEDEFKKIFYSLEKYSAHPIARSIADAWKTKTEIRWKQIEEIKGMGVKGEDLEGNIYMAGSYLAVGGLGADDQHSVYLIKNGVLAGWLDLQDEIRPEAKTVVDYFHKKDIRTILLSGDRKHKCDLLAKKLGIEIVIAEQTPAEKLERIAALNHEIPTAMIGDGINDAPALARASVGISMSDASQIAMQTADVVLMNNGIKNFPLALGLGKHTFMTIKENLFWAFFYNVVAIPCAAFGFLSPAIGALAMGLSDVVLAANSVRLFVKKID